MMKLSLSLLLSASVVSAFVGPALPTNSGTSLTSSSMPSGLGIDARIPGAGGAPAGEAPSASASSLSFRSKTVDIQKPNLSSKNDKPTVTASSTTFVPKRKITVTETPKPATTAAPVYRRPKITTINSREELMDFLEEDDRLCVIKFHASWCKTCRKFGMQFKRIGKEIGDVVACNSDGSEETLVQEGDIRLVEIEYGANTELCKSLGIKKLPSVHFYSRGTKVDGFACGPKKLKHMIGRLQYYRSLSLGELQFEAEMNKGSELLGSPELRTATSSSTKEAATSSSTLSGEDKPSLI